MSAAALLERPEAPANVSHLRRWDIQSAPKRSPRGHLRRRHREVLELVAQGFSNAAIAERLVLAPKTVEHILSELYARLGIETRDRDLHPRVRATLLYLMDGTPATAGFSGG